MRKLRITVLLAAIIVAAGAAGLAGNNNGARASATLPVGWNNVAYTGSAAPPTEALDSMSGKYSVVYRWDATEQSYDVYAPGAPDMVNTLSQLNSGDSVWVYVTEESAELSTSFGGNVSVAASTFTPASDLALFEKSFNELHPVGDDEHSERYYAPVSLPDGANISNLTAHFAGSGVRVRLDYTPLGNGADSGEVFILAEANSAGGSSPQTASAYNHTVDNGGNVYFLVVDLTNGADSRLRGVSIEYTGG